MTPQELAVALVTNNQGIAVLQQLSVRASQLRIVLDQGGDALAIASSAGPEAPVVVGGSPMASGERLIERAQTALGLVEQLETDLASLPALIAAAKSNLNTILGA